MLRRNRSLLALILLLVLVPSRGVHAESGWFHGRVNPPIEGVYVRAGNGVSGSRTNQSGYWGFFFSWDPARVVTLWAEAPDGWRVVGIRHPLLGSTTSNVIQVRVLEEGQLYPDFVVEVEMVPPVYPTPNPTPTLPDPPPTPSPTPTTGPPDAGPYPRFQQFTLAEQESIISTAYLYLGRYESDMDVRRYDDQTMVIGQRWLNGPPMSKAFEVRDSEGYRITCRAFVWGIVAIHENRAGVYQFGVVDWDGGFMKGM